MAETVPLARFLARPGQAEGNGSGTASSADTGAGGSSSRSGESVVGAVMADAAEFSAVRYQVPSGYRVRELRGDRMRDVTGLFDEFAAALQFPYYFGGNKDAFDDCLRDLDDFLGPALGYVVAIRDADQVLAEAPDERRWFTAALQDCAEFWAGRDIAFRVVLQGRPRWLPAVAVRL
ncbi:barstar family protein [Nocardia paucivorans]|uniref:barstar family protein n=1 Tax=Nocardia paucivorans TaxID=114259 RepID=UPI00031D0646|nr:barstar family protein [Nocardia paucivorans]